MSFYAMANLDDSLIRAQQLEITDLKQKNIDLENKLAALETKLQDALNTLVVESDEKRRLAKWIQSHQQWQESLKERAGKVAFALLDTIFWQAGATRLNPFFNNTFPKDLFREMQPTENDKTWKRVCATIDTVADMIRENGRLSVRNDELTLELAKTKEIADKNEIAYAKLADSVNEFREKATEYLKRKRRRSPWSCN